MTDTLTSIKTLRETLRPLRINKTIALVPTMGNLHEGHLSLVKLAQQHADIVVVSIFVNPTQFGIGEDLESYPRSLEADIEKLTEAETDYIFTPTVDDMYPVMPPPTQVLSGDISQKLCGKSRPTHFDGVGIVVTKLFNIVQPDVAVFGQKDFQQLSIIKQLVRDLSYDIQILSGAIVRAEDGLALSSRNQYLTQQQRQIAPKLNQELSRLAIKLRQGEATSLDRLHNLISDSIVRINEYGFQIDYLEVRNQDLSDITNINQDKDKEWVILAAAWLGKARLLDNHILKVLS